MNPDSPSPLSLAPGSCLAGEPWQIGAAVAPEGGVTYRVWAPDHERVEIALGFERNELQFLPLEREADGYHAWFDPEGSAGNLYQFRLDGGALLPDPASRFQPFGVTGPSQVVDPRAYAWRNTGRQRPPLHGRVIYELHVGTFTPAGTFAAAIEKLDALAELGVNAIELMPLADFPGQRNWGYDGVMLFAPARCYGTPDDLRALVDAAHARGLAVIVDVVYNHLGPCDCPLPAYSRSYLHRTASNPWGDTLNFDGEGSDAVRHFFLQNVVMWLDEYRVDGLRLDATHAIHDESPTHIVAEIAAIAQARGAFVIAEDDRNDARVITPREAGGWGADAQWADDFHHTVRVALTGQREAHFSGYTGQIAEWVDTMRHGWLYRGQVFPVWNRPRGNDASHLPPERFVVCISNHDQVGNRPLGERLHHGLTGAQYRAVSMLLCLTPFTPLLFMGQEWAATTPFYFFTDLPGEVGEKIGGNRIAEFRARQGNYPAAMLARMPDPQAEGAFDFSKLDWTERERGGCAQVLALYRECLQLRARELVFQSPPRESWSVRALGNGLLGLRWNATDDWLLLVSVAPGAVAPSGHPEFLRPKNGTQWEPRLASEEKRFGGTGGMLARLPDGTLQLAAPGAVLLRETRAA